MAEPGRFWGASLARMVLFVALTLLLFSVGFFVPVLGFGGFLAVPLPLAILGMRDGGRWQAAGVAFAGGGLALLLDPLSALYYLIAQAPLSYGVPAPPMVLLIALMALGAPVPGGSR